ncbi:hypothetical protein VDGL01_02325 [Verticillium dahliae]
MQYMINEETSRSNGLSRTPRRRRRISTLPWRIVERFGQKLLQGSEEKLQRFLGGVREHMMGWRRTQAKADSDLVADSDPAGSQGRGMASSIAPQAPFPSDAGASSTQKTASPNFTLGLAFCFRAHRLEISRVASSPPISLLPPIRPLQSDLQLLSVNLSGAILTLFLGVRSSILHHPSALALSPPSG